MMIKIGECFIDPKEIWFKTDIHLEAGKTYRFLTVGKWKDLDIECGPDSYDVKTLDLIRQPVFRQFESFRPLDTGDIWFSLIGKINDLTPFQIGSESTFTPTESGYLVCAPNDLPLMHWNNSGSLKIEVFEI
ncbi:MAG: hypothetical protein NW224_17740 [Leptolyngbyaceae cyanobacterium bins.302]|nr:hypothetical protein [Leptolyngbyaceae cyanobacterium bins.302]